MKTMHVLGNGDKAVYYHEKTASGKTLLCNMPPFAVDTREVYATTIVDFKMMAALTQNSLNLDMYPWVLGTRPRIWMNDQRRSSFYLRVAQNIKEFYTVVPEYAGNATNFNCGHMAVHYAANRLKCDEIHMYGFDTIFDHNIRSVTDFYLNSDRSNQNNYRLINNWRPVWEGIFREFPNTKFVMHHNHDNVKLNITDNVEIVIHQDKKKKKQVQEDLVPPSTLNRKQKRAWMAHQKKAK